MMVTAEMLTSPAVVTPITLLVVYLLWVFAPGWLLRRELARYARIDAQREYERGHLTEALAPLQSKVSADDVDGIVERYLDKR
jgi:hypothetical protein